MTHMKRASHVRRGQHDAISMRVVVGFVMRFGFEIGSGFPARIPITFNSAGVKTFFEFHGWGRGAEGKGGIIAEDPFGDADLGEAIGSGLSARERVKESRGD
jgi:hypothetical protein